MAVRRWSWLAALGGVITVLAMLAAIAPSSRPNAAGRPAIGKLVASQTIRSRPTGFFPGWFVSRDVGWLVMTKAGSASLYRTADGGRTWASQLQLPYPKLFERDLSFVDESTGFVVTEIPTKGRLVPALYATTDGGQHWQTRSLPGEGSLAAGVDFISGSRGWVLIESPTGLPGLYTTADGGRTWTSVPLSSIAAGSHLEGIRFEDASHGFIGGWSAGTPSYFATSDGGATWVTQPLPVTGLAAGGQAPLFVDPPQRQADGVDVGGAIVRGSGGAEVQVFESTATAPGTWTLAARMSAPGATTSAWSVAGGRVMTSSGRAMAVTGRSASGAPRTGSAPAGLIAVQLVTVNDGFAITGGGPGRPRVLYSTADGGGSWTALTSLDVA